MKWWELIVLVLLVAAAGYLIVPMALQYIGEEPAYIVAAERGSAPTGGSEVLHLTDQDFADHPALVELIRERKKVLRAGDTSNFLLGFFSGTEYSRMPISAEEERRLFEAYAGRQLEYEGKYYEMRIIQ
ncbi:MAG: hypothetical protein EHJ95_01435 [Methanobacteriota archaeon]|nr:MAG: hypothetical protein EHJ95_01435 [Euryarchaeota archaeon]